MLVVSPSHKEGWKMPKVEMVKLDDKEVEIVGGGAPPPSENPIVELLEEVAEFVREVVPPGPPKPHPHP
jgi:hypothetical protein